MMNRSRVLAGIVGLIVMSLSVFVLLSYGNSRDELLAQAQKKANKNKQNAAKPAARKAAIGNRPVVIPDNATGLTIEFGLKDKQPTDWDGAVQLSEGRVLALEITRGGGRMAAVDGNRFTLRSTQPAAKKPQEILNPVLSVSVDAPPGAKVMVDTKQGQFAFVLSEVPTGAAKEFLDGQVSVERQEASSRLTDPETEDDYPALARGSDGSLWLAYVEYKPSEPVLPERILAGNFDLLEPKGHGDKIRLRQFDGKAWLPPIDVTEAGLDVWRPTVTVDGKGRVCVAWAQQVKGNWDIDCRHYTPGKDGAKGEWSSVMQVSKTPGSDFQVVSATDSKGRVWLAWQSWNKDNFDIAAALLIADATGRTSVVPVDLGGKNGAMTQANEWGPALAADSKGHVYVAWDTYDKGNYDVRLLSAAADTVGNAVEFGITNVTEIAHSPRFEARPSLVCDSQNRVWIAYEEGDEQWGKDFSTNEFRKIPFDRNPGFALYINRTVKVKCLVDGKLMQPAGDLEEACKGKLIRGKSHPRLATDAMGGVWLALRHHPLATGNGEAWNSFALRYDGKAWSSPRRLANSANLMDNRPALAPFVAGIMAVYSGDARTRTQDRDQADLFAAVLTPAGETQPPQLVADQPAAAAAPVAAVHPNETADLARIRGYRLESGGKQLRLLRGEFHRHTEYSAHRDGDGTLEDSFRYGLDAGNLDWMGNGDHDNGNHHEFMWWQIQKYTDLMLNAPRFVAAQTYERSNQYPNGHRNVIMPRRGIRPLPRGDLQGTPEKGTPDTKLLYAFLKHYGGICSSHTSGTNMGTDWRDNDPEVEPVVEIYQGHRHNYEHFGAPRAATEVTNIGGYQPSGVVWNALAKGYKLGFQSSSDHISTHISYAIVLTEDASREGIIAAFKKRHSYAATDNIILDVRSGEHLMGDIFETGERPSLEIVAHGTGPIAKLDIVRDNKYVYSAEPKEQRIKVRYTDMEARPGQTSYYYVRVQQADGNLAWASPLWITYKQ